MTTDPKPLGRIVSDWFWNHLMPTVLAKVVLAILGLGIFAGIGYHFGHGKGLAAGTITAQENLQAEYEKRVTSAQSNFNTTLTTIQSECTQKKEGLQRSFNESLDASRTDFERKIYQEIQNRYASVLTERFEQGRSVGFNEGVQKGRQDGLATGRKEGSEDGVRAGREAAQLEDALEQFLVFFLAHIDTLAKEASAERPNKDKLRDAAIALRESARRGRESFEEILKQLNGTIDELYQAVESGNMDRTISLARAITNNRKTIEAQIKAARAKLLRKSY